MAFDENIEAIDEETYKKGNNPKTKYGRYQVLVYIPISKLKELDGIVDGYVSSTDSYLSRTKLINKLLSNELHRLKTKTDREAISYINNIP